MKVAYLINQYPKVSHSFIRREILGLEHHGVDVTRIAIRKLNEAVDVKDMEEQDKTICLLEANKSHILGALIKNLFMTPFLFFKTLKVAIGMGYVNERGVLIHIIYLIEACVFKEICKKKSIDHVHSHFGTNATTVAMLSKLLGGPGYSFTAHGPGEFDSPKYLFLEKKIINSRFVCAISSFGKSQLMRWCNPDQWEKLHVIHCAVEENYLHQKDTPFVHNKFIYVGRLTPQKGPLFILKALKELIDEGYDIKLDLVGDGELRSDIESFIYAIGLTPYVTITGWMSSEQVKNELQSGRALVLPSFAEGLPVVIMEALALKRPVISTYVAGIPELVDSECGVLVPAGSIEGIKDAIKSIMVKTDAEIMEMGKEGYIRVSEHHNPIVESAKLLEIMQSINI